MFQITLRTGRESCGYTTKESADYCGISIKTLEEYESNSELVPAKVICKLSILYNIPLMLIFIGTEADCVSHNRNNTRRK